MTGKEMTMTGKDYYQAAMIMLAFTIAVILISVSLFTIGIAAGLC